MSELKIKNSGEIIEVKNVFCIGKNYLDHINEMNVPGVANEVPESPVIFLKPSTAICGEGTIVKVPVVDGKKISDNLQNEVELVIIIGKDGDNIPEAKAAEYVLGYAVGIDFTLRDLQNEMKKKGKPWAVAKGFRTSSPVSEIVKSEFAGNAESLNIRLKINDEVKQSANTSQMIFKISFIIHYISSIFGLKRGDIIFTGTPAGITKLNPGDRVTGEIEKIGKINVTIG